MSPVRPKRISKTKSISQFCTNFVQFCTLSPKFCTAFLLAQSAIQIWGLVTCSLPPKCSFKIKNWIIILSSFCTILHTKSQILYTIPSSAICNSNLEGWRHAAPPPPPMQFQHKKLDHNFLLNFYNFVHQVLNFVNHPSSAIRIPIWTVGDM